MNQRQIKGNSQAMKRQQLINSLSFTLNEIYDESQCSVAVKKPFDLIACIRFLLSKAGMIVLCGLVCALLAGFICQFVPPQYEATAKLYILDTNDADVQLADLQSGSMLMADYREVFRTWEVHDEVKSQLGLDLTYREMQEMLSVQVPEGSRLLYITVRHRDAVFAATLANTYAQAAHSFIVQSLHGLQPDIFSSAIIPSETVGMGVIGWILAAFAAGLLLSAGGYALFFCLDDRIHTPDDLHIATGLPVFTSIPRRRQSVMTVEEKENACLLASRLITLNVKCIMVTAQRSGDGASFVCADLLQALTALHRKAVWIRVEHKPFWNASSGASLGDYLEGCCGWEDLVHPFEGASLLSICGTEDELPSLLFHPGMSALMDSLRSACDVILVDVPPADQRADASAFFSYCDGMLLVAACGHTRLQDASAYAALLGEASCPLLGAVLNRAGSQTAARIRRASSSAAQKEGAAA